jgi:flagellar biosynthetic protein FliR
VISAAAESYRSLPVGGGLSASATAGVVGLAIQLSGQLFVVALGIAAPVIAVAILTDLSLGIAGRVAPRLPLYFLGLPIKALGTLGVLLLTLSILLWSFGALFRLVLRGVDSALVLLAS